MPTALDTHPKHDVALGAVQTAVRSGAGAGAGSAETTHRRQRPQPVPGADAPAGTPGPDSLQRSGSPGADGRRLGGRTRMIVVGGVVAAVVAGVVTGVVLVGRQNEGAGGGSASLQPQVSAQASGSAGSGSTQATQDANGLPVSSPLTATQLIVPQLTGDNWDLWLADTDQPGPLLRLTTDPSPDTTAAISPDRRHASSTPTTWTPTVGVRCWSRRPARRAMAVRCSRPHRPSALARCSGPRGTR